MNDKIREINGLNIEIVLSIIFIFISLINIYGDQIQKKFLITGERNDEKKARKIFAIALIISIFIYLYFIYRNYNDLQDAIKNNQSVPQSYIRLFGSILILVGALCILYYIESSSTPIGQPAV